MINNIKKRRFLHLLLRQSLMDVRKRYFGTMFGSIWAVVSPLTTIVLIFFVFKYGLKASVVGNISFLHWFVPAMLVWTFMSEAITISCTSIIDSSFLVTKMVFPVWILPLARVFSTAPVHLFLMSFFVFTMIFQGISVIFCWIQVLYYLFCALTLCVALSYVTSSLMVFVRDVSSIIGVILQIFFWATPIFWNPDMLAGKGFEWLLFSPFNYIVQGYRDSLFNNIWFWERPVHTFAFWMITSTLLIFSIILFKRTRPHFADVL